MTWFAIHQVTREIVASAESFIECSDKAWKAIPWGYDPKGEVAPYFLTTDATFFTKTAK